MLTKEEQTQLASYYRNRDLYDPSKAQEQTPPEFKPQGLADGGFPDVSQIEDGSIEEAPDQNEWTRLTKEEPVIKDALVNVAKPPVEIPAMAKVAPVVAPTIQEQNAQSNKLDKNQYDELIAKLSQGPSVRQRIGYGLAGLGDAIVQGVSRAGNPGFQQHAIDRQKMQQEALANALRSKYEAGFKAQELGQGKQRLTDENTRAEAAIAGEYARAALAQSGENSRSQAALDVREKEAEAARAQSGLEAAAKLPGSSWYNLGTIGHHDTINQVRQQLLSQGLGAQSLYSTPQAHAIKAQFRAGIINRTQAKALLDKLHGPRRIP